MNIDDRRPKSHFGTFQMQRVTRSTSCMHSHYTLPSGTIGLHHCWV